MNKLSMLRKSFLVLTFLFVLVLASCAAPSIVCQDGRVVADATECITEENNEPTTGTSPDGVVVDVDEPVEEGTKTTTKVTGKVVALDEQEVLEAFEITDHSFSLRDSPNDAGDRSAVQRIAGSALYDIFPDITYLYRTSSGASQTLYLKVISENGFEGYSGKLENGGATITPEIQLTSPGNDLRLQFCISNVASFDPNDEADNVVCLQKLLEGENPRIATSSDVVKLVFDTRGTSEGDALSTDRGLLIVNNADMPVTTFLMFDELEGFDLSSSKTIIHLDAQEEEQIDISADHVYNGKYIGGQTVGYLYALADNCDISESCRNTARLVEEFSIEFRD